MPELTVHVDVDAPVEQVWRGLVDWDRQGEWMLGTSVEGTAQGGQGVGGGLRARTALGPLGFTDEMEITRWEPPRRCEVRHLGKLVRGTGLFEVRPLAADRSRLIWSEFLSLPMGRAGRLGWVAVRPVAAAGLRVSLRRFARWVTAH